MSKNKKLIYGIIVFVLLILIVILYVFHQQSVNHQEVALVDSLIKEQEEKEQQFAIEGYRIDEPNIIVNPYGNSPLSA